MILWIYVWSMGSLLLVPLHSRNWVALLTSWYHLAAVCWALQQVRRVGQTICLEFELNAQTQPSFIYTPCVALVHPLNGIFFCWLLYCQNCGSCWDADLKPLVIGIYPPTHVYCWIVLCPWARELVGTALHCSCLVDEIPQCGLPLFLSVDTLYH